MVLVAHQELQRMLARLERYLGLGLAPPEMQMIEVIRYRFIERRKLGIDEEVVVTRVLAIGAGGRNPHIAQSKKELQLCRYGCSVLEINKVHLGARAGRSGTSRSLSLRQGNAATHAADEQQCREKSHDIVAWNALKDVHSLHLLRYLRQFGKAWSISSEAILGKSGCAGKHCSGRQRPSAVVGDH